MEQKTCQLRDINWRGILAVTKKVLFTLLALLCAFLFIVAAWLAIDKFILKSPVPSFAGFALLSVESGSMEGNMPDSIAEKDLILIRKTNDYRIGETISFLRPGDTIPTTHRIIDFDESDGTREYITRGDANGLSRDANVTEDMILGEVVFIFHGVGALRGFLTEGGGYIFVVALLLIIAVGIFLLKMEDEEEIPLTEETESEEDKPASSSASKTDEGGTEE